MTPEQYLAQQVTAQVLTLANVCAERDDLKARVAELEAEKKNAEAPKE